MRGWPVKGNIIVAHPLPALTTVRSSRGKYAKIEIDLTLHIHHLMNNIQG